MEDPTASDPAVGDPRSASVETYPVTTTSTTTTTTTTTTKSAEECSFECPDNRCVWQFGWDGNPSCTCKAGDYDAETGVSLLFDIIQGCTSRANPVDDLDGFGISDDFFGEKL